MDAEIMPNIVRIGNAQAFWGDRVGAPRRLAELDPDLDYLTLDYLAETTLATMASQRERSPELGYAQDFVEVVRDLAPLWKDGFKAKVITNAGGLNPMGCAEVCAAALREAGHSAMSVGVVSGDDILPLLREASEEAHEADFANLETGAPMTRVLDRLLTANAYTGSRGVVEALERGADIVITGRVADPCLTVGPFAHHFGCSFEDYDALAGATVAGHIIEGGSQACGGLFTHWLELPDLAEMAFPIVEVEDSGDCVVTIPEGAGGACTEATVKEQILSGLGDPARYLSPDCVVDFLGIDVREESTNRIRVSGCFGAEPPPTLKVGATYRDGYRATAELTIFGRHAIRKAQASGKIIIDRLKGAGYDLERWNIEWLGGNSSVKGLLPPPELLETVLRISVADPRREAVERFAREVTPLLSGGAQGTTDHSTGRPQVSPAFGFWPCLVESTQVETTVELLEI
jgi:hypothetical protein